MKRMWISALTRPYSSRIARREIEEPKTLSVLKIIARMVLSTEPLQWLKSAGWLVSLAWARTMAALGLRRPLTLNINAPQVRFPVIARLGNSSDINVFYQIFLCDEYVALRSIPSPRLIMDLGANVGYSSAYFLNCFPTATVIAVEPDPENFELCRKNLAPYGDRAHVVLGAIWSRRSKLVLSRGTFGDGREWATQVRESEGREDEGTVEGWDILSLLQQAEEKYVDLLKVDIERSELEILRDS